jgi:hypothetical protein
MPSSNNLFTFFLAYSTHLFPFFLAYFETCFLLMQQG